MADSLSKETNLSRELSKREFNDKYSVRPLYDECFTPEAVQSSRLSIGNIQELIFTIGLPASGKTTWAKNYCETQQNYVRVSRDDLRNMRGLYWLPKQEDMITDWETDATALALINGMSVIVDATNLNAKRRLEFVENVKDYVENRGGYPNLQFIVNTKMFDTPVEECIERDNMRKEGHVGKKVILQMANKYGLETKYPEYRQQAGLPNAIICDLDGTLARNETRRGFYDWKRVGEDSVDETIKYMLDIHTVTGDKIIIMSGRDGVCRPETVEWLGENNIEYDILLMREPKDQRKDSIVKRELFEKFVRNDYNILFALDDRDQVVDMWRKELGIKCLQVNYGNF